MTESGEPDTGGDDTGPGSDTSSSTRTLEIGFFFDGTLNNYENADGSGTGSYANAPSNVALLERLYSTRSARNDDGGELRRRSVYLEGIGTRTGGPDDAVDAAFGTGNTGVSARVHAACRRLERELRNGYAEVTVDAFGFSRGAAAARYFVNCVNRGSFEPVTTGFLMDDEPTHLGRVRLDTGPVRATVRFLGIFDTVAAIGYARDGGDPSDADNADVNVHLDDSSAQAIYHLTAHNEYRRNFALNSIRSPSGACPSGGVELALPGAHSDVGGGYRGRGEVVQPIEPAAGHFSTRSEAEICRADLQRRHADFAEWVLHDHFAGHQPPQLEHGYDLLEEYPHAQRNQRFSYFGNVVWHRRPVRPGLEKVALDLMHHEGRRHGVPFAGIPNDSSYAIPNELAHLPDMFRAGRQPGAMDLALMRLNFIHWSAHYGAVTGIDRSAFKHPPAVTVGVYPMEPAPNWRRIVHRNRPSQAW
jgi:hypothetical protein